MLRWRPPEAQRDIALDSGAIRVDHARWITFRPVARLRRCGPPLSVHGRSIARCFSRDDVRPERAGVRANGTREIAARTVVRKWAFAGHRGSGYLAPSEMHARLKALLERMAKDLNARLDLVSAIP
jgi:hypothetical protein